MTNHGILVIRRAPKLNWALVRVAVLVDGKLAGKLRNRDEVRVSLPEGTHIVQATSQGVHSVPVNVKITAGNEVVIETIAPKFRWALALMPPGTVPPPRPELRVDPGQV